MMYRRAFLQALRAIRFEASELAYLALTSKPELQVRDRLAYRLYHQGFAVAREWRRCDLAVLDGSMALALLESKAAYTFDMLRPALGGYSASIRQDARKARALGPRFEVFVLIVLTHVSDPVPKELRSLVKYGSRLSKVADSASARGRLRSFLKRLGPVASRVLGTGRAFDVRVVVEGFLCGPVR